MKKCMLKMLFVAGVVWLLQSNGQQAMAAPQEEVKSDSRCAVCGMFVAKYPVWLTQIRHADDTVKSFDGVKDMMVYYFNPAQYGSYSKDAIKEIWVKDYYTSKWLDGRTAVYVVGSDVKGPMGHEFIPFATRKAAETFMKDHKGKKIVGFDEITSEQVQKMRAGHKMKMKMK